MGDMMMRLVRSSEPSLTGVNSPDFSGIRIFLSKTTCGLWQTSDRCFQCLLTQINATMMRQFKQIIMVMFDKKINLYA